MFNRRSDVPENHRVPHITGGLSRDRGRVVWASIMQHQEWQGRAPGKQICPSAEKQGLQPSNNRRHAGDLPGMLCAVRNGIGPMTQGAGSGDLGLRPWESQFWFWAFPKVAVWHEISYFSDLPFSYLYSEDNLHFTKPVWSRLLWENGNESALQTINGSPLLSKAQNSETRNGKTTDLTTGKIKSSV